MSQSTASNQEEQPILQTEEEDTQTEATQQPENTITPAANDVDIAAFREAAKGLQVQTEGRNDADIAIDMLHRFIGLCPGTLAALQTICKELPETAELVEHSTRELSDRFQVLADGARQQTERVENIVSLASKLELDGKEVSLPEFTKLFDDTLAESVNKILQVSKLAMQMVFSMDEAIKDLEDTSGLITHIQKITKQTRLLALNATIESARAGEAGKSFAVVANEVKDVAQEIANLSDDMNSKITSVQNGVLKGYDVLKDVATTDMSDNIMAKENLDKLMKSLMKRNAAFTDTLKETASASQEISDNIMQMTIGMQFQDRTSQVVESCVCLLSALKEMLEMLQSATPKQMEKQPELQTIQQDFAEMMVGVVKLSHIRNQMSETLQGNGITLESQTSTNTSSSDDEDDVELF
jgi:methyl-accepting chemotaxis protein